MQRAAADRLLPSALMRLLEDDDAAVQAEAATCLAALADHCGTVTEKIAGGFFLATADKAPLNPVQETVGALDGVFNVLVNFKFSDDDALAAAGSAALGAVCALSRANQLRLTNEVTRRLAAGEARALAALDDAVSGGLDARADDVAVLLDQALAPALGFLRTGAPAERAAAAALLGSIAEGRRGAASFLVAEGALADAAALLAGGADVEARDAAARLVWALVREQRSLLSPGRDKGLGVDGVKLLEPLLELIELVRVICVCGVWCVVWGGGAQG